MPFIKRNLLSLGAMLLIAASSISLESRARQFPSTPSAAPPRTLLDFDDGWLFSRGDFASAAMPAFRDSSWRPVSLPHDWSSEGPFSAESGSGNGYAPGGLGWYRKHFRLDPGHKDKIVALEFDGVYAYSEVWINGQYVGGRPYGYSSFECRLTPYVKFGGADNVIAVRVDHTRFADSRWYTGSGIYRHVRLRITDALCIVQWGTFVTTPRIDRNSAAVRIETTVENGFAQDRQFVVHSEIIDDHGGIVAGVDTPAKAGAGQEQTLVQEISIARPRIWSIEAPVLYKVRSRLTADSRPVDETATSFGIRSIRFDPNRGFFLNDAPLKLKGVCLHHDAGSLGAAVPEQVWERRLRALKDLGVNAIRTAHNPPAPELLDLCDRLGLLVKDEAFDEFTPPKNKWVEGWNAGVPSRFGYGEIFAEWSVIDVRDLVRRDRNHPSVILWSIGNEIDYPNDPFSHPVLGKSYRPENPPAQNLVKLARPLIEAVKGLDSTRPVTAALASLLMSDAVGLAGMLDAVGYNYQEARYAADHQHFPGRFIFGSENGHQFSNWAVVRDNDYVAGQFLWTGIDYLGEARVFPNRANGAGLLDLCGFKKPNAWFRQSLWSDRPMVYICATPAGAGARPRGARVEEHWNWDGNATLAVSGYTNCPEVQLTLNDRPLGARRLAEAAEGVLSWEVPYEPGILKAVGIRDGKPASEFVLKTAGQPDHIELQSDAARLRTGGKDIFHVEFRIVDARGVRVPNADMAITFEISGPAGILGIGNGDLNDTTDGRDHVHKAYQGRGLAILQSTAAIPGTIVVNATAPGLGAARLTLPIR